MTFLIILGFLATLAIVFAIKSIRVVPQQTAFVVERLGKYHATMEAGLHLLVPFVDRVAYKLPLQEIPMDTEPQTAITKDNVTVSIDGVLYYQVTDPHSAAYGTSDFRAAIENLAKTTLRSEAGKRALDELLSDRAAMNAAVVLVLDDASVNWGVKVLRYEVKDISPPPSVLAAMQLQMTAEREKRALIARSEGQRTEQVNLAEGKREAAIAESEGERQAAINRATGEASAMLALASATADSFKVVAQALAEPGADRAMQLRVAEQYIQQFGNLAKEGNTLLLPTNMGDMASLIAGAMSIAKQPLPKA